MSATIIEQLTCCGVVWKTCRCGDCGRRLFHAGRSVKFDVPIEMRNLLHRLAIDRGLSLSQLLFDAALGLILSSEPKD